MLRIRDTDHREPLAEADAASAIGCLDDSRVASAAWPDIEEENVAGLRSLGRDARELVAAEGVERDGRTIGAEANATRVQRFFDQRRAAVFGARAVRRETVTLSPGSGPAYWQPGFAGRRR